MLFMLLKKLFAFPSVLTWRPFSFPTTNRNSNSTTKELSRGLDVPPGRGSTLAARSYSLKVRVCVTVAEMTSAFLIATAQVCSDCGCPPLLSTVG